MFEMMPMSGRMNTFGNQSRSGNSGYQPPNIGDNINRSRVFMPFQGAGTQIGWLYIIYKSCMDNSEE